MVGVNLLLLTAGLVFLLSRYLHSWPNLVFGFTSGGIFVCTTTVNCCVFLPQVPRGLCRVLHGARWVTCFPCSHGGQKKAYSPSEPLQCLGEDSSVPESGQIGLPVLGGGLFLEVTVPLLPTQLPLCSETYCVAQANLKEERLFLSNLGFRIAAS